jgi:gliding motility-associated-like protein
VIVTVQPQAVNQPPIVSAGSNKTLFLPTNSVVIIGSATDADGSIASLLWTQVSGGVATLLNENTTIVTVSDLVEGTYVFRLTGTDDSGASSFSEVTVTVNAATVNQPPVADAGPDINIKLPANSTTVAGSGTDVDGVIASYQWIKVSGPTVTVAGANSATLTLTNMVEGAYIFELTVKLTVTDNNGETHFDRVNITVLPAALNTPPTVSAGADVSIKLPENSTTLFSLATDPDGTIVTYVWTKVSGPAATLTDADTPDLKLSGLLVGTYVFRLEVTDDGGLTAFDEVQVTQLPEITVPLPTVSAGDDQEVQLPDNTLQISAVANAETLIESYLWTQIEGDPITFIDDSPELILEGLTAGRYSFRVVVRDDLGQEAADEVVVVVLEPEVKPHNVFSPNDDDVADDGVDNDVWNIQQADKLDGCDISVYNRQGQKVFQSQGYSVPWDGTSNGKPLPEGVYIYVIKCSGEETLNGTVTIIR